MDYIFFEDNYEFPKGLKKNIYDKYFSYYGELSAFNKNNYSYIYEKNDKENTNENYKKWNEYLREENNKNGLKIIHKCLNSLEKYFDDKNLNENLITEKV